MVNLACLIPFRSRPLQKACETQRTLVPNCDNRREGFGNSVQKIPSTISSSLAEPENNQGYSLSPPDIVQTSSYQISLFLLMTYSSHDRAYHI